MYVSRTIEKIIKKNLADFPAVVLTGFRQTGKSTLLKTVYGDRYKYVNFDKFIF